MSGDFDDWDNKPAKEFRSEQDYKETKHGKRLTGAVKWLFLLAIAVLLTLYFMGVLR